VKFRLNVNSLSFRLIAVAAVWALLAFAAGGVVLSNAFRASVLAGFDADLVDDLTALSGAVHRDPTGAIAVDPHYLGSAYRNVYSGHYWQVMPQGAGQLLKSDSVFDKERRLVFETQSPPDKDGNIKGYGPGPYGQYLRMVAIPYLDASRSGPSHSYMLIVAADMSEVENRISEFNSTLLWSFVALGLGLIAAVFIQVRIGLQPLRQVAQSLHRIRDGSARRLEGRFPSEIEPLASELNSLIEHSAEVVGRARSYVSNLAHFLKTPLTVLVGEAAANPGPLADQVERQVTVMRRQVDHYLARARAAGALDVLGNRTPVGQVLEDLARTLRRIHQDRALTIDVVCPPNLAFRGERQDLEEMAGNLIDNACKWARSRVLATAFVSGAAIQLAIEDDGPGLTPDERKQVGSRGERLDESVPGSGLGLAIVRDIAKLYGGGLELGASELGGLKAVLSLPAIQ
jgi:signal transduction histidine kinase